MRRIGTERLGRPALRLQAITAILGLLMVVLVGRLVWVQGLDATAYASQASAQRSRTTTLTATRGQLVDRFGHVLAMDVDARMVTADPSLVTDVPGTAAALAPLLHLPTARLRTLLKVPGRYVVLTHGLSPAVGADVRSLQLPGVIIVRETKRLYPSGDLAASVLGFTGANGEGQGGLEYAYQSQLAGIDGESVTEVDPNGREIPNGANHIRPPRPGQDLVLTIDRDIQWMAQDALTRQVAATGSKGGTAIVMDPRTGEVLALATAPSYDPNNAAHTPAARLGNPALSNVYEPGSVNKVITAAAALEAGVVTPSTEVDVPASIKVGDRVYHDAEMHGLERLTFAGVLAKSSNIGTILTAQKLGPTVLYDYLRRFGFGQPTGSGFPGESAGLLPVGSTWNSSQATTIPFGQGVSVTALQAANVYATVANGGIRLAPRLVRGTVDSTGRLTPIATAAPIRVISAKTASTLTGMLEAVTSGEGTAPAAAIDGYRIAGKTGTARRISADGRGYAGYVATFVGFAPADNPRLLVEVVLDDPKTAIFGGVICAPVFHQVMAFALQSLRIPPTGRVTPSIRLTIDQPTRPTR